MRQMVTIGFVAVIMVAVSANAEPTSPFGAEPIGVVFEDAALSNTTRSSITGDLARLFSFSVPIRDLFDFDNPVNGRFEINEIAPAVFSKTILTGLVCNVSANHVTSILVRASLSTEYIAKQFSLSAWTNAIASLDALISDLNSGAVTNYPDSEKLKLLALESGQPSINMVNASMEDLGAITYYPPSVLDFMTGFNWAGHTNALAARIRTLGRGEAISAMYSVPVLYEDGAWKFIISE